MVTTRANPILPANVYRFHAEGSKAVGSLYRHLRARLTGSPAPDRGERPWYVAGPPAGGGAAEITQPLDDVDIVLRTSGSTDGTGHLVGLSLAALGASASATLDRLAGPGQWLTSLPLHGVAGLQVVTRSALAAIPPLVPAGRGTAALVSAIGAMRDDVPRYLSVVPTQLLRLLEQAPAALRPFAAILVGGAALPPALAARAEAAGIHLVRSYGMTETAGGCVYDGRPLDGVRLRLVGDRIHLTGPMLATRYLDTDTQPFVTDGGVRWLVTGDLGALEGDGRLAVLGRADDVIVSGGTNVPPAVVEARLTERLGGAWVVLGLPDLEWGARVVAVREAAGRPDGPDLAAVRTATADLPPAFRPKGVHAVDSFPLRPTGKVDRRALGTSLSGPAAD